MDHVADGEPLAGQDLLEISATAGIDPLISVQETPMLLPSGANYKILLT